MRSRFSRNRRVYAGGVVVIGSTLLLLAGCGFQPPAEFIAGSTGSNINLGSTPSVQVFSPETNLVITSGTSVEVTWLAVATTSSAVVDLIIDPDTDATNGNELYAYTNMPLTQMSAEVDTQQLTAGDYHLGLIVKQLGEAVATGYAPGVLTVSSAPTLFFNSPRNNYRYDRSARINPTFEVNWTLDPQARVVSTRIYLDPDGTINGNEVLLRTSASQTGDSFSFDLPTAQFEPGTYRILAQVSDGSEVFTYYAPGSIVLRARGCGVVDLRDLDLASSTLRGAVFEGFNPRDNAGSYVTSMRDLDADGFDDFVILAQFAKPGYETGVQRTGVGEAYVIYGRPQRFSGVINLNSTGTLFRGSIFTGVPEIDDPVRPSRGITSFTLLTDWDGDGVREFAFGLPFTDSRSNGAPLDPSGYFRSGGVIVVAGSALRPDLGFPGRDVVSLGDIGSLPHMAIAENPPCPEGFVSPKYSSVAGSGPDNTTLFHQHLADAPGYSVGSLSLGCRFSSNNQYDYYGESISTWDFHTLIISAPNLDPSVAVPDHAPIPGGGLATVYFNVTSAGFFPWNSDNAPPANSNFNYPGTPANPYADILPHGGPYHYVLDDNRQYLTSTGGFRRGSPGYWVDADDSEPCAINEANLSTFTMWTDVPGAHLTNTRGIGDMNGDGLYDLLVGAPFMRDGDGTCFIVLGRIPALIAGAQLNLSELALPMDSSDPSQRRVLDGIQIVGGPGDRLGQAQDYAGDFNNDGLADVLIGSQDVDNRRGGAAIFFGSRDAINLTQTEIPVSELPARGLGVIFLGVDEGDLTGARVASARDVDGDGNTDILIAAPNASVRLDIDLDGTLEIDRTQCGVVYLIYGSPDLHGVYPLTDIGTERLPGVMAIGRNSGDQLGAALGEQGDRGIGIASAGDVDGDGRSDILLGSASASPRDRARAGEVYLIYGRGD
jgi:hypothetical protein